MIKALASRILIQGTPIPSLETGMFSGPPAIEPRRSGGVSKSVIQGIANPSLESGMFFWPPGIEPRRSGGVSKSAKFFLRRLTALDFARNSARSARILGGKFSLARSFLSFPLFLPLF